MPGESPLSMMQPPGQRLHKPAAGPARRRRRRRLWPVIASAAVIVVVLAFGWVWLWYYAAGLADRRLAGWVEREAAAGRVYSCGAQTIGGFPFRVEARCADVVTALDSNRPPYTLRAKTITVATQVFHPTLMVADITGPLTLAESGRPPSFFADWSRAQVSVHGLPPDPDGASVSLDQPRLDRAGAAPGAAPGAAGVTIFTADHADLQGRVIGGSPRNNPVIEAVLHLAAAAAPTLHPLAAQPTDTELDAVLRGFKDLSPKPWAARFREMQAAGGGIEIKYLRIAQADTVIVGAGTLSVNAHGKLDGLLRVAVVGIENIVPRLGVDRLIGRGINRLTGAGGTSAQGFETLDRLVPGLGGAVRDSADASLIENLKKMGEPTEVDNKPAIVLPLRFADGAIYLGLLPLGEVPPLF